MLRAGSLNLAFGYVGGEKEKKSPAENFGFYSNSSINSGDFFSRGCFSIFTFSIIPHWALQSAVVATDLLVPGHILYRCRRYIDFRDSGSVPRPISNTWWAHIKAPGSRVFKYSDYTPRV